MFVMTAVVRACAVAKDNRAVEILLHDLRYRKLRSSAMNLYSELVEQFNCTGTNTSTDDIGAIETGEETRQYTMFMLWCLEHFGRSDHTCYDSKDCYFGSSTKM